MGIRLKPAQKAAAEKLRNGNILCGGTGSGKSLTSLAYFYKVCRGEILKNGELSGHMQSPMPLYIITTAQKRDKKEWEDEIDKIGLAVLPLLVIDSWNNLHKYVDIEDAFFIFDEQRVTGSGQWVKSFWKITKYNRWILLTATPGDKWTDYIPVFVANGFYRNPTMFNRMHVIYHPYITQYPKIIGYRDTDILEKQRRSITVLMECERGTTQHWNDIWVPYPRIQYETILKKRWNPFEQKPVETIAECCYLMRRAVGLEKVSVTANHSAVKVNRRANEIYHLCCEEHPRLIVFYNFDYELEAMKETFRKLDELDLYSGTKRFTMAEWNGHKHEMVPESERWVYLVQYMAGAEGWNCTDTNAMAFFSMNYSYKQMTQAAGRIDRLNTPFKDLYYYVLKSKAPIEQAIEKTLNQKQDFNEKLWFGVSEGSRD